jgi:tRNA-dihydrouridine synthase B
MGCPAKKVCNVMAGSALMQDEPLVARILEAVVSAAGNPGHAQVPHRLEQANKNAPMIARIAEESGIQLIAIHGRTRACQYTGQAEYDTIADVKTRVRIPVIANGDITTPQKAKLVLDYTGADGVMIGRAAQGRPWIFREIEHFLKPAKSSRRPLVSEILQVCKDHLTDLYGFYGEDTGVKIARKHISWYTKGLVGSAQFRRVMNTLPTVQEQTCRH